MFDKIETAASGSHRGVGACLGLHPPGQTMQLHLNSTFLPHAGVLHSRLRCRSMCRRLGTTVLCACIWLVWLTCPIILWEGQGNWLSCCFMATPWDVGPFRLALLDLPSDPSSPINGARGLPQICEGHLTQRCLL